MHAPLDHSGFNIKLIRFDGGYELASHVSDGDSSGARLFPSGNMHAYMPFKARAISSLSDIPCRHLSSRAYSFVTCDVGLGESNVGLIWFDGACEFASCALDGSEACSFHLEMCVQNMSYEIQAISRIK